MDDDAAAATGPEPFASAELMEQRTDGAIPKDRPYLEYALRTASDMIRDYCGWVVAPLTTETLHLDGPDSRTLVLPTLNLVELVALAQNAIPVSLADVHPSRTGTVRSRTPFVDAYGHVAATIRHGLDPVPSPIVDLTLQMAARALGSPLGVVREQSLVANITWSTTAAGVAGGTVIMEHEKATLAPYRIVSIA